MKGVYPGEEIERMSGGFQVVNVVKLAVPGLDAERHLVIVAPHA
jgi:16S rRNA (guanine527-N7)-methyltransferase